MRIRSLISIFTLCLVLFAIPRSFFIHQGLVGEEGMFADLFHIQPPFPKYGLDGRVQGKEERELLIHPSPLYQVLILEGAIITRIFDPLLGAGWRSTALLRSSFSLFQLIPWLLLAALLSQVLALKSRLWWAFAALITCPLAVGGSLYLQTDPTSGALSVGLFGVAIAYAGLIGFGERRSQFILALSSLFLGFLSKQEWSLGVVGGLGLALFWGYFRHSLEKGELKAMALIVAGLALGNFLSWWDHPPAYEGGFNLILNLGAQNNVLQANKLFWLRTLSARIPFLMPLFVLWGILAWAAERTETAVLRWGLACSLALALPYLGTVWGREYRYFIPAFMLATPIALVWLSRLQSWHRSIVPVFAALILFSIFSLGWAWEHRASVTEQPGVSMVRRETAQEITVQYARQMHCVAILDLGFGWDLHDVDWVNAAFGYPGTEKFAHDHGGKICQ